MRPNQPHPSVIYEIVVDRFFRGDRAENEDDRTAWLKRGDGEARLGGDLHGVIAKLDHLQSLGVDTLLLSPVWPAGKATGDQIEDFSQVSEALGGDAAFTALIEACRQRKLWLMLTGVFDRVSRKHHWFLEAQQQEIDDGRVDPAMRRRSFFKFDVEPFGYAAFRGDPDLPELNLRDHHLRHNLFHGDRSVVRRWIERGIDGWCVEHAESLGYDILHEIQRSARSVSPECLVIGNTRAFLSREIRDGTVDGVVNHFMREAMLAYLDGRVPAQELSRVIEQQAQRYGNRRLMRGFNPLSAVGDPRCLSALGEDITRFKLAIKLQYVLPGAAIIHYGDEVGLSEVDAPGACLPMCWDQAQWNKDLLDTYRALGRLRSVYRSLVMGDTATMTPAGASDLFAVARHTSSPRETVLAVFNRGDRPLDTTLFVPVDGLVDGLPLVEVFTGERIFLRNGTLRARVPPVDGCIWVPDLGAVAGYTLSQGSKSR